MGPGGFFPTNPDLADILGRTDFDFDNLYFWDFLDPKFLMGEKYFQESGPKNFMVEKYFQESGPKNIGETYFQEFGPRMFMGAKC